MRAPLAASRLFAAALALVFSACKPDLPQTPTEKVVTAVFDPTTAKIPLPNDLVFPPFNSNLNSVCPNTAAGPPSCAQAELLASFNGKFPNDQEVAITIDFSEIDFHSNGVQSTAAPELDFATFTSSTFFVVSLSATGATDVPIDPPKASDYAMASDHGTLTIHHKDHAPWPPGQYVVGMRGGNDGVKTADGTPVSASQIFDLIAQGKDLSDPANLGLLRAQTGSLEAAIQQGAQLNALINVYKQSVFVATDPRFAHQELAIASTFAINTFTNVVVDAARGIVPLPIDLLRDPVGGHLTPLAACTLAGSKLGADGICPSAAAGGFQALDGFSTTGPMLAQTSDLIIASTVRTPGAVLLFDLTTPAAPVQVSPADYIAEPCEVTVNPAATSPETASGCTAGGTVPGALAPAIVIQPAGATNGEPGGGVFRTKPLKDATDYAVVVTNAVHDKADKAIGPGTVATILRLTNPIVVGGKSQLQGVDDATGAALEKMRLQLQPVFAALPAADRPKVAMAYTFRTQTILSQALGLGALPYSPMVQMPPAPVPVGALTFQTAAQAFQKWGVDSAVVPFSNIDQILEVDIETLNALDPITGAFMSDPTKAPKERIHVIIATPLAANVTGPACLGAGPKCAPMMVFRHGLGSGRGAMLTVADSYAAAGMVTVAIDAAKHGDRSFCTSGPAGPTTGCNGGAECVTLLPPGAQGDAHPPGTCGAAGFIKRPVSGTCAQTPSPCPDSTDGIPAVSSNYLTSTNFFRTRDTLRQDVIDQSQLVRALAFVPTNPPTAHAVFDQMAPRGVVIDPGTIFFSGQSLGSIQGVLDVATNPRISKAAFNVGGGTITDIFTNSPAFKDGTEALLAQLGIKPGTPQFLQFLVVAKTVLDPADPINFVGHLTNHTLPNLLRQTPALQDRKKILTQIANCDQVVPNPFNLIYTSNAYAGNAPEVPPVLQPTAPAFFAPGATGAFQLFVGAAFDPRPTGTPFGTCTVPAAFVAHAFLTDWAIPSLTQNAQNDIAKFVTSDLLPLSVQHQ